MLVFPQELTPVKSIGFEVEHIVSVSIAKLQVNTVKGMCLISEEAWKYYAPFGLQNWPRLNDETSTFFLLQKLIMYER